MSAVSSIGEDRADKIRRIGQYLIDNADDLHDVIAVFSEWDSRGKTIDLSYYSTAIDVYRWRGIVTSLLFREAKDAEELPPVDDGAS